MSENTYDSVWNALENTPEEAENMRLRSRLMMALADQIKTQRWTQRTPQSGSTSLNPASPTSIAERSTCSAWTHW